MGTGYVAHRDVERVVWSYLRCNAARPTVSIIARGLGCSERHFRRLLRRSGRPPARDMITFSAVSFAASLISQGTKIEAAMLMAGFRNRTNFCAQCRRWLGCLPSQIRTQCGLRVCDAADGERCE
jgi:AraC-like DNA-binding protein